MEKFPIQTLLRAMHDPEYRKLKDFIVVVKHRGAPKDKKEIDGERILRVQKDGFWYKNRFNEETFIPAHRMIKLKDKKSI